MTPDDSAHKSYWQTSEVIFGIPFLAALALQWLVPFTLPLASLKTLYIALGAVLIILGVVLIVLGRRVFAIQGQRTDPGNPTTRIMTDGVFGISRNPLYLGVALFVAGVGLAFRLPWVLVMLVPSLLICHWVLIVPEERYLTGKFGEEYLRYMAAVHRWIGRNKHSTG